MNRGLFLLAVAAGCGGDGGDGGDEPETCDTWVSWENFVEPQLRTWCTPCHGVNVVGENRHGAPDGIDFDTLTDARQWSERIAARVETGTMPPAGGLTEEERALLVEWATCGAPGASVPELPDPCLDPAVIEGDRTVSADDPDLCGAVTGDLTVTGTATLDCLCRVDGDLLVGGDTAELHAPRLLAVGGEVSVQAAPALTRLELPMLGAIGGDVVVSDATVLAHADLRGIVTAGGSLRVLRNPVLDTLYLDRVEVLGGDYELAGNPVLANWRGSESPRSIGGSVRIVDNDALVTLDAFGRLTSLGGGVNLSDNDAVGWLIGFHQLIEVPGGVRISDNASLTLCETLPDVVSIGSGLTITGNPQLAEISGFAFLATLGQAPDALIGERDLRIEANPDLEVLDSFERLVDVHTVVIAGTGVGRLDGFPALQTVDGIVEIRDNPQLLGMGMVPLVASASVVTISGNQRLAQVLGFDALSRVGRLTVVDNPALNTLVFPSLAVVDEALEIATSRELTALGGFATLDEVGGDLAIRSLETVVDLTALHGLERVGGTLTVRDNPALPSAQAAALVAAIETLGASDVGNNGP